MSQLIIAISREYGSGGHEIGKMLAEHFQLDFYDHNLLDEMFGLEHVEKKGLRMFEEVPKFGLTRTVRGMSSSPEHNLSEKQFEYIENMAKEGRSFVICGRCAESILKDYKGMISFFVLGDYECKLNRIMQRRNMNGKEAALAISRHDKKRKAYHNYYCDGKWGDSRLYDLSINSSRLGINGTANLLINYIKQLRNL